MEGSTSSIKIKEGDNWAFEYTCNTVIINLVITDEDFHMRCKHNRRLRLWNANQLE